MGKTPRDRRAGFVAWVDPDLESIDVGKPERQTRHAQYGLGDVSVANHVSVQPIPDLECARSNAGVKPNTAEKELIGPTKNRERPIRSGLKLLGEAHDASFDILDR